MNPLSCGNQWTDGSQLREGAEGGQHTQSVGVRRWIVSHHGLPESVVLLWPRLAGSTWGGRGLEDARPVA